jgi:hypothetical protein
MKIELKMITKKGKSHDYRRQDSENDYAWISRFRKRLRMARVDHAKRVLPKVVQEWTRRNHLSFRNTIQSLRLHWTSRFTDLQPFQNHRIPSETKKERKEERRNEGRILLWLICDQRIGSDEFIYESRRTYAIARKCLKVNPHCSECLIKWRADSNEKDIERDWRHEGVKVWRK